MFLTVHAAGGLAVAQFTDNYIIAFVLGFFSHFLLDIIPHGDEHLLERWRSTRYSAKEKLVIIALTDFIITLVILYGLFSSALYTKGLIFLAGAFGGMAPDFIQGFVILKPFKIGVVYNNIHHAIHRLLNIEISFKKGIIVQLTFLFLLLYPFFF